MSEATSHRPPDAPADGLLAQTAILRAERESVILAQLGALSADFSQGPFIWGGLVFLLKLVPSTLNERRKCSSRKSPSVEGALAHLRRNVLALGQMKSGGRNGHADLLSEVGSIPLGIPVRTCGDSISVPNIWVQVFRFAEEQVRDFLEVRTVRGWKLVGTCIPGDPATRRLCIS